MICGSCLRDNRLAATLVEQGRPVVLMPLYTPLRTDEPTVSRSRVLYGGIDVYLRQKSAFWRALPRFATRWLDHPAILRRVGMMAARTEARELAELTLAVLRGADGPQRAQLRELVEAVAALKPRLVNLPNLLFLGAVPALRRALPKTAVVCTLSGEDLFIDELPEGARREVVETIRGHAAGVHGFIATSRYYAEHATRAFGLPAERVHAVPMGIRVEDADGVTAIDAPGGDRAAVIGYFARVCRAKGLLELARAFAALRAAGKPCRLVAGGYLGAADRPYLDEVKAYLARFDVLRDFQYVGELPRAEKFRFLATLDVFSVPSPYREAKGLYVLEAKAAGVPVVQPDHGSFPELIEATGGGLLFEPGNVDHLASQLDRVLSDSALRKTLSERGRAAVRERFNDRVMAEATWAVYERAIEIVE